MPPASRPAPQPTRLPSRVPARAPSRAPVRAGAVPWGHAPTPVDTARSVSPVAARPAARRATGAARASAQHGGNPATVSRLAAQTTKERRVVAVLLTILMGVVLSTAATTTRSALTLGASRERIGATLGRASLVQMEFRSTNARFARWEELEDRGMRLTDDLAVIASTSSQSHWFLRLRDRRTGVTCARIGQLFDSPTKVIAPTCE